MRGLYLTLLAVILCGTIAKAMELKKAMSNDSRRGFFTGLTRARKGIVPNSVHIKNALLNFNDYKAIKDLLGGTLQTRARKYIKRRFGNLEEIQIYVNKLEDINKKVKINLTYLNKTENDSLREENQRFNAHI